MLNVTFSTTQILSPDPQCTTSVAADNVSFYEVLAAEFGEAE